MLSNKTKYGLKAVFYLARQYEQGQVLITDLAKKEKIPQKFLEAILLELKKKGVLNSKKGKGGGYSLGRNPKDITVGEIIRVLEGPLAMVTCVSESAYARCKECRDEQGCEIRMIMKDVRDAMSNILDRASLSDVIERAHLGKDVLNYMI